MSTRSDEDGLIGYDATMACVERTRAGDPASDRLVRLRVTFAQEAGLRLYEQHRPEQLRDSPRPIGSGPGIQGPDQVVEPGAVTANGMLEWTVAAVARRDPQAGRIRWIGSHVHGRPGEQFLYLSWKAPGSADRPDQWIWRLKLPLQEAAAVLERAAGTATIEADVSTRVTHDRRPVGWSPARP